MRKTGALLAGLMLPASFAAAATITLSDGLSNGQVIMPGTPMTISVYLKGTEEISGAQVMLFIGDGGPSFGGSANLTTSPKFVALGSTIVGAGYLFGTSNNAGNQYQNVDIGFGPEPLVAMNATQTITGTVPLSTSANGGLGSLLATFQVSTVGSVPGCVPITVNMDNSVLVGATIDGIPNAVVLGLDGVCPEPAMALLLMGALPFLRRRQVA